KSACFVEAGDHDGPLPRREPGDSVRQRLEHFLILKLTVDGRDRIDHGGGLVSVRSRIEVHFPSLPAPVAADERVDRRTEIADDVRAERDSASRIVRLQHRAEPAEDLPRKVLSQVVVIAILADETADERLELGEEALPVPV